MDAWDAHRRKAEGGGIVNIQLKGDEVSDVLNFVLKDNASGRWSDNNGSNFAMGLKPTKEKVTTIPDIPSVRWISLLSPSMFPTNASLEIV